MEKLAESVKYKGVQGRDDYIHTENKTRATRIE